MSKPKAARKALSFCQEHETHFHNYVSVQTDWHDWLMASSNGPTNRDSQTRHLGVYNFWIYWFTDLATKQLNYSVHSIN